MDYTEEQVKKEATRLYEKLQKVNYSKDDCNALAPLTLEINKLKKEKNAVILAHSYQTADIIYGVADFIGDSLELSKQASTTKAEIIVFGGVKFMAETAKILSPKKTVLLPSNEAGCSLSESITAKDVKRLKEKYPKVPVICYVNTTAEVKAECDACCTSANGLKVVESFDSDKIIFLPDKLMAQNIQNLTKKKIISWNGLCVVHKEFNAKQIKEVKERFPGTKILVHTECSPSVVELADFAGGTTGMINYAKMDNSKSFMMVTECGLTDRMKVELIQKDFVGSCELCPYMKKNTLELILQVLKKPEQKQIIELDEKVIEKAGKSIDYMMKIK
ncbi:MAG: quinolinate synthase [Candidatus Diapherotrites archaeon CG_4_10_14_0_2_um_filter_31_5]|nr:MAG: quinolinate synthase [Candidatus Diapherotrites archaeon CG_4_10_14_0_2_um_filter_31_5]